MRFFLLRIALFSLSVFTSAYTLKAQLKRQVLFLGNSYTYVNNLPQLVQDVALSAGDTLVFDSYAQGGYQLINHMSDPASQNKINAASWDYVIIQGQSQEPIIAYSDFTSGAAALYNLIKQHDSCTVVMPYMTWGRKNGDPTTCPFWPQMCTYLSMDTTIRNRYLSLTSGMNGEVSPVSVVWNYIRQNHPNIELYQADESHPSTAGSYAAACCFYTMIFKKDPTLISYDFGLPASDASAIRNAAKTTVFNNLSSWDFKKLPDSKFAYQIGSGINQVMFSPLNPNIRQSYFWDFGDGATSTLPNPIHSYAANGTYTVSLTTKNCDLGGWHTSVTDTVIQFCSHTPTIYTTHPWLCEHDTLWTQVADAYQWLCNGALIPETNQYLTNQSQYGPTGFSVIATVGGCSELSETYSETPEWSGYYFDAIGDPCSGDTVAFAVLHASGFLTGTEIIRWYKNDTLLSFMNDEDSLLITTEGKYQCKVIDPAYHCPLDTSSFTIVYNCGGLSVSETTRESVWMVYPNPASSAITIKYAKSFREETIQIYSVMGRLVKELNLVSEKPINISDLPSGLYLIRMKHRDLPPLKFIRQ